ncbi:ChrR family anti-sigma-E factor [Neptunomonas antarctica]|uniref:Anti-ECFsigma factor, ChrR n=1 Tax=Neptunomonas antarctica TaxID=619304 RepID=A0A1N7IX11_9GAMM|nr:ChrR family anti-sigma-E factor [Neptunomonas antarctica]SIS41531.1 anti-ECFsigma factor, ChrR [Neptunomonas antarctica]
MSVNHHPDDATLLSYASGSLLESFEILVACHLRFCQQCRLRVDQAEQLGGAMLESAEMLESTVMLESAVTSENKSIPFAGRAAFAELLDDDEPLVDMLVDSAQKRDDTAGLVRTHRIPEPLQRLLESNDATLAWKRLVPGIQQIRLDTEDDGLRLMKIAPGMSIPLHTHKGSELTFILYGSYSDELGRLQPGDVSDLDAEVEHQPITDGKEPCICLVATDAPLKFHGFLPKLLQPFIGF